ncbi:phage tail family protein [Bacillus sonorensis]|uniref:phage tail family protein n=1 Tax=Bacillus sonorensis TaxID=119858 RepID=UPI00098B69B9|nr:phage tail family protein [Bacillus sonorensis]
MPRSIIIQKQDGTTYDLSEYGVKIRDVIIPSVDDVLSSDYVEGGSGIIPLGTRQDRSPIKVDFDFRAMTREDFFAARNTIFRILRSPDWFYLIDNAEPYRRWKVYCNAFEPERIWSIGRQNVGFTLVSPYAESINSTDIPLEWGQGWDWGRGFEWGNSYSFTLPSFTVNNTGDETIDPRNTNTELKITYTGASTNLRIRNLTTGDDWQYTGQSNTKDIIVLDGIRSLKNGLSIFRNTNRQLITLAPGENEFQITGTSGIFTVNVDFRFLYV